MTARVSIVILNWNGRKLLRDLLDKSLESALSQDYPWIEVIFADNASTDDSVDYVRSKFGDRVKIVHNGGNYGYALGNNLAVRHVSADSKFILIMNPDVVIPTNYVSTLVDIMERRSDIGVLQGLEITIDKSGDKTFYLGGFVTTLAKAVYLTVNERLIARLLEKPLLGPVLWATGAAVMIRKDIFTKVGGFSPEFFMYWEDVEMGFKNWCAGFKVCSTTATYYFHIRGGGSQLAWYFASRNRWIVALRYFPLRWLIVVILHMFLTYVRGIVSSAIRGDKAKARLWMKSLLYVVRRLRKTLTKRPGTCKMHYKRYILNPPTSLPSRRQYQHAHFSALLTWLKNAEVA